MGQKTHWLRLREGTYLLNMYVTRKTSLKKAFMTVHLILLLKYWLLLVSRCGLFFFFVAFSFN